MNKCKKCKYEWNSRKENPKECPKCKSRLEFMSIKMFNKNNVTDSAIKETEKTKKELLRISLIIGILFFTIIFIFYIVKFIFYIAKGLC